MHDSIDPGLPPATGLASSARDCDSRQAGEAASSRATLTLRSRSTGRAAQPDSRSRHPHQASGGRISVRTRGDSAVHMVERVSVAGVNQSSRVHASEKDNAARWSE
jgi:hypothetical protein